MTATTLKVKLEAISDIIRLRKQYGTVLLLCPTLWSLFIVSGGRPSLKHMVIFVLGAFLMRSAGCVINDIADRKVDCFVERTKGRALPSGRLKLGEAVIVFFVFSLLAFVLVCMLNNLTILLSVVAIILAATYPLVKRVSHMPQMVLGMAFGWGSVMAWSAVAGTLALPAILIFIANIFWAMSYDTIYALMDIEDDRKVGIKSMAILLGKNVYVALYVFTAIFILILALVGWTLALGVVYFLGLAIAFLALAFIIYMLKRNPTESSALNAFIANAFVGVMVLVFIVIDMRIL
ncbi:MAG: 4-hydroxybenzoate octaprenyltransferase [Proteobacteria bacterium]|nr:4-hydroxybenzoate octaprenyltransferase [Pseudomonadota bacterium]